MNDHGTVTRKRLEDLTRYREWGLVLERELGKALARLDAGEDSEVDLANVVRALLTSPDKRQK